ncbi:MAG: Rrf2 family transcriptional regulator [Fulvivirga sp.]
MFSKACEYGIRAVLFIAQESIKDRRVSLKEITRQIDSPDAFTAKILQKLARAGVVQSIKGPSGGFEISKKDLQRLKLSSIVNAIDGDSIYKGCGLGLRACNANKPCPVHHEFAKVRDELKRMLETTSVFELATQIGSGLTFLKR